MFRKIWLLSLLALGLLPTAAQAAQFTVTRYDDPSPVACIPGNCTLREAINAADAAGGTNTVLVPAGVYSLKQPKLSLNVLGNTVTIKGVGGQAVIDGDGNLTSTRAMYVFFGGHANLQHVDVRGGVGPKDADNTDRGGGIRVDNGGSLTMSDGAVYANTDPDSPAEGGGIYDNGQLTLNRVKVEDNFVGFAFGGGIYVDGHGRLTVTNSVIANNSGSFGGGLTSIGGSLDVNHSLIRDNSASDGGGAYIAACGGNHFTYDTFAGNTAGSLGGAIRNHNASVFLDHVTAADNEADGTPGGGGGVAVANFPMGCPTDFFIMNTIIAKNRSAGTSKDCLGDTPGLIVSHGFNIVGDATGCGATPTAGDHFGTSTFPVDPKLGFLKGNGGPTFTMALLGGSPAIRGASATGCGPTDQRGFVIAHDGDTGCDIGAYEVFFAPKLRAAPQILGNRTVGSLLFCTNGSWGGATPQKYSFQWLRNGRAIRGATGRRYRVGGADHRQFLRCSVTATNVAGKAIATSGPVRIA